MNTKNYQKHYEENIIVLAKLEDVFAYADDHRNFSSHMNQSSWLMGGSRMDTQLDEGEGKKAGSHIKMSGKIFGLNLFLDEVIVERKPPIIKYWETVGKINLLVIDHYRLGFEVIAKKNATRLKVFIDYNLPEKGCAKFLGLLFGYFYAKWCVKQMAESVKQKFNKI